MGEASLAVDHTMELPDAPATLELLDPRVRLRGIVREHFDFVWRLLRRLGVQQCDADDAAQRVFWVASNKIEQIRVGAERSFLYGTAQRVAWAVRRDRSRRREVEECAASDCADTRMLPDEEVDRRRRVALLDQMLAALPDELRAVFILCEIEGLTGPEVAAIESIPVGTVASRLRRARQELEETVRRLMLAGSEGRAR